MELLNKTVESISAQDENWRGKARERLEQLTMPHWALGRLMDLALDLAGITRSLDPPVSRKAVVVMAADHGVVAEGVSNYPPEVTAQMVHNFAAGGAGINALAGQAGADVLVIDMGVAADLAPLVDEGKVISKHVRAGTSNMAAGPAMSRDEAVQAIESGIDIANRFKDSYDVLGTGEMGIGNTTPSAAIVSLLTATPVKDVTGHGTGIDFEQRRHKMEVIEKAIAVNQPDPADPIDVLAKVGGFEIAGIAGLILGTAANRKPIVVDGFISTAGALIAHALEPESAAYMIAAHRSVEQGHRFMHDHLGLEPLLDLSLRLGEGTGAALAMNLVQAAALVLTQVATFEEAAVSEAVG